MLKIENLNVKIENKQILKGFNLEVNVGEVHVIMGPNGAGKSSFASAIMGHPSYEVSASTATIENKNILDMEVDERAKSGLFMAFQYPMEISGITTDEFLYNALQSQKQERISDFTYYHQFDMIKEELKMSDDLSMRHLNVGFSGGEKKRNEIFQMKMLKPKIAILDEIDSGLDIDALKTVAKTINNEIEDRKNEFAIIIITHYRRFLEYLNPTHVHVMKNGKIVETGGIELIDQLEESGYESISENNRATFDPLMGKF